MVMTVRMIHSGGATKRVYGENIHDVQQEAIKA